MKTLVYAANSSIIFAFLLATLLDIVEIVNWHGYISCMYIFVEIKRFNCNLIE